MVLLIMFLFVLPFALLMCAIILLLQFLSPAITLAVSVLLVLNGIFFLILLAVYLFLRHAGVFRLKFLSGLSRWKSILLRALHGTLVLLLVWELVMVGGFAWYLWTDPIEAMLPEVVGRLRLGFSPAM